jgi:hypothetical protein
VLEQGAGRERWGGAAWLSGRQRVVEGWWACSACQCSFQFMRERGAGHDYGGDVAKSDLSDGNPMVKKGNGRRQIQYVRWKSNGAKRVTD